MAGAGRGRISNSRFVPRAEYQINFASGCSRSTSSISAASVSAQISTVSVFKFIPDQTVSDPVAAVFNWWSIAVYLRTAVAI
jgi:hypothetical protein